MNNLKTKIKDGFNRIFKDEKEKNEFFRYIELIVLLPAATYVSIKGITDWNLNTTNFWLLYLPSLSSALFWWLKDRDVKFIFKIALLIIANLLTLIGALYIASQCGLPKAQVWWERIVIYFSI